MGVRPVEKCHTSIARQLQKTHVLLSNPFSILTKTPKTPNINQDSTIFRACLLMV